MQGRLVGTALLIALTAVTPAPAPVDLALVLAADPAPTLADYRLFIDTAARTPNVGLTPYALATPLFSDYADKARLVFVPPGTAATYTASGVLDFPVGTVLVKTFAYGARKLETRLLLRKAGGWVPNTYVWNDAQDTATLKRTGARIALNWQGRSIDYAVPNANQCKQCHLSGDAVTPIGPRARNLNVAFAYAGGAENQLSHWTRTGVLRGSPAPAQVARTPVWDDARETLDGRARAYLDVNCAHCHSRKGFASNSGLYLDLEETDPAALGIGKRPVAAGRGSGGHEFAIQPGDPARSILVYRMASTEPGVMMPQFGRTMPHDEGVALIRAWIARLPPS